MMAVLRSIMELVATCSPARVFMCTFDRDLPPKALTKHLRIVEIFQSAGYVVEPQQSYHGEKAWWMERGSWSGG